MRERVRTRDHGLRGERLGRPTVRHLRGDDPPEVGLEADDVHDLQRRAGLLHAHLTAVGAAAVGQRPRARREEQRRRQGLLLLRGEPELQAGPEHLRPGRELVLHTRSVTDDERGARRDHDAPRARRQEYANLAQRRRAERRARVVVQHDLVVAPAVERIAVRAVLGEPDPVSPAVPGDKDHRERLRSVIRRGGLEPQGGKQGCCECCHHRR